MINSFYFSRTYLLSSIFALLMKTVLFLETLDWGIFGVDKGEFILDSVIIDEVIDFTDAVSVILEESNTKTCWIRGVWSS